MRFIDLNADLGEGGCEDEILLGLVSSANIACGGHAGDPDTMRKSLEIAHLAGVSLGAHPGYEDQEHFGRRAMALPLDQVRDLIERQVGTLAAMATEMGIKLKHVKPHGALYNQADKDPVLAAAVVEGMMRVSPDLVLFAPPGGKLAAAAKAAGVSVRGEGFVDRGYRDDGSLMPRGEPGAVISRVADAVAQASEIALNRRVRSQSGALLPLKADTLCVHGDGTTAVATLRALRAAFDTAGLTVSSEPGN